MKCSEPGCNKEAELLVNPHDGSIIKHLNQATQLQEQVSDFQAMLLDIQEMLGFPGIPKEIVDVKSIGKELEQNQKKFATRLSLSLPLEELFDIYSEVNFTHVLLNHFQDKMKYELKEECKIRKDPKRKKILGYIESMDKGKIIIK